MVKIPTEDLERDVRGLAIWLGKQPTTKEYTKHGKHGVGTIKNRFGSWTDGLEKIGITETNGFPRNRTYWHTKEELCNELQRLENEHGKVTTRILDEYSDISVEPYQNRFGSWNAAVEQCDCETFEVTDASRDKLTDAIRGLGQKLERRPGYDDFHEHTKYNFNQIYEYFDSYSELLSEGGFLPPKITVECDYCGSLVKVDRWKYVKDEKYHNYFCDHHCHGNFLAKKRNCEDSDFTNYRQPFWDNREKALERDGYRCQSCGLTNEEHLKEYGRSLTMHHISREHWPQDPERHHKVENLVTLCNSCHPTWEGIPVRPQLIEVYG